MKNQENRIPVPAGVWNTRLKRDKDGWRAPGKTIANTAPAMSVVVRQQAREVVAVKENSQ